MAQHQISEDDQRPIFLAFLAPLLRAATPVYWADTAFHEAALASVGFDPHISGSSFHVHDLVGRVEWWYLDVPGLMVKRAADETAPDGFDFRLVALLVFDLVQPVVPQDQDLAVVPFCQASQHRQTLYPAGIYSWRSDEACGDGWAVEALPQSTSVGILQLCGIKVNALMHWRQSKLAQEDRLPPSRACRRRIDRLEDTIAGPLIITLRAHENAPALTEAERHYVHTWWVRGHERHLPDGRVVSVRTYLKGPDGAPLLAHESTRVEVIR